MSKVSFKVHDFKGVTGSTGDGQPLYSNSHWGLLPWWRKVWYRIVWFWEHPRYELIYLLGGTPNEHVVGPEGTGALHYRNIESVVATLKEKTKHADTV